MILINTVVILLWWNCFKNFNFIFTMNKKYSVFTFVFHSFQCFDVSFFAHCIRAMYMFILPTKVKSMSIECIILMIYNLIYARALYFPPLRFQSRYTGADHWSVACKSILRMNPSGILSLNVHCASEMWSSGCILYYRSCYWNKKISWL